MQHSTHSLFKDYCVFDKYILKDEYLKAFLNSIDKEYCIFFKKDDFINSFHQSLTLLITFKELLGFLENLLKTNLHLNYNLSFYEFESKGVTRKTYFYTLKYNPSTRDIFFYKQIIDLQRTKDKKAFEFKRIWHKEAYILKEDKTIISKIKTKFIINKYANTFLSNPIFKEFFLSQIKTPIIKDIKCLDDESLNYLKIDYALLNEVHNIQELMEKLFKKEFAFNLNKLDIFVALSFILALNFIPAKEHNKLYQFLINKHLTSYERIKKYIKETFEKMLLRGQAPLALISHQRKKYQGLNLLKLFLVDKFAISLTQGTIQLIEDYTKLVYLTKELINLNIKSLKRMQVEHDRLVSILNIKQIPKSKKLKIDTSFLDLKLPKNFKLLKNEKELYLQGEKHKNCVYTRKHRINQGLSAIYNLNLKEIDYTLELIKNRKNQFSIYELKERFNQMPPKEIFDYVKKFLRETNCEAC
ncbi:hypothetical protein [Helicobacter winghamensis]|uniref:hypothetical protein n=1 Tax=Helicobacter winghamensis TaxID=157268 RepID=UPI0018A6255B|nr:hypothetical protein [Helicobacter winghamensis]QOQ98576.1 hypothetical protein A0Z60_03110 [Helicobacter winghamensis]